jgi:hypothetical protein
MQSSISRNLYATAKTDAIPHFKEAQRLDPDNWNYRGRHGLSDAERLRDQLE